MRPRLSGARTPPENSWRKSSTRPFDCSVRLTPGAASQTDLASIQRRAPTADSDLMAKKKAKPPRVYRDASTGRFVTKKYAKKHPKTTIKERRRLAVSLEDSSM